MRNLLFFFSLVLILILSVWLLLRLVINTDPALPANVAMAMGLIFLGSGSLMSLISWLLVRRVWHEDHKYMALRHGIWAGLFVVTLPLLRWMEAMSLIVVGAILLIIFGMEAMILLQNEEAT